MKKIFFTGLLTIVALSFLSSCGSSRKLGCPATAQKSTQIKNVVS